MPQSFPISGKVIAPYWNINIASQLNYTIIKSDISELTKTINLVNNYLAYNFSINFNADWILVAQWININTSNKVCVLNTLYFNICWFIWQQTNSSSFQAVLASQGNKTYAIFTYKCDLFDWNGTNAIIGFSASNTVFANFPLSRLVQENINCLNSPTSNWSNIVYEIGRVRLH